MSRPSNTHYTDRKMVQLKTQYDYLVTLGGVEFYFRRVETVRTVRVQVWEHLSGLPRHNLVWWKQ